ncbi:metallophosphoesterase family protein [Ornithinibacillus contaminans]|uniref:hypothetical protein n=1 Tax=Ornithinibacillus contaminans TaxID=694055 RepID=UPI000AD88892|nr:hypothetical protein [Ornithinibacillus contaminans]
MIAIDNIPFLLAGPIIRRVEPNQVYIWMTTSENVQVEAQFFQVNVDVSMHSIEYEPMETTTESSMVQAGKNLYIYLVKITPYSNNFPTDCMIGYNLLFKTRDETFHLGDLNLLDKENPHSIVYGNLSYPTFIIQDSIPANILYGSCQKPHGKDSSVITVADDWIEQHAFLVNERPNALFFMGDQIYADDVADYIFYKLWKLAQPIIDEDEQGIQIIEPRLKTAPFQRGIDQINGRQYVMNTFAKFTSNHASNHLIRFSEYAMMYLVTLGPSLWQQEIDGNLEIPSFEALVQEDAYYVMYPSRKKRRRKKELKQLKQKYEEQLKQLRDFIPTLAGIRRVLANTPTYMIFDDHDITDDWNISSEWIENVQNKRLGKHIITNGLTAYWLFQGWGNDPEAFRTKLTTFTAQLKYHKKYSYFPDEWTIQLPNYSKWTFIAPTKPKALFLDIRTLRQFDSKPKPLRIGKIFHEAARTPQLIGKRGWNIAYKTLRTSNWKKGDPIIVVSPTPLYGLGIIESFLKRFVYPLRAIGLPVSYALDFEAWKYNGRGFNRFIQQLLKWQPEFCYILSGDVHYANAVRSTVYANHNEPITIYQFTSSPIHNMSFSGLWGLLLKFVVWFNSLTRKKRTIYRTYDEENSLTFIKKSDTNGKQCDWQEHINYLTSTTGSIMHTQNNIGLIMITSEFIQNRLLKHNSVATYQSYQEKKNDSDQL